MKSLTELYEQTGCDIRTHYLSPDVTKRDRKRQIKKISGIKYVNYVLGLLVSYAYLQESRSDPRLKTYSGTLFVSYDDFHSFFPFLEVDDMYLTPTTEDAVQLLYDLKYLRLETFLGKWYYALRGKALHPDLYTVRPYPPRLQGDNVIVFPGPLQP